MTLLEKMQADLDAALAKPNPPMPFPAKGTAAIEARGYGAVTRVNRYGVGGAWVGYDYLNSAGHTVIQSMACS